MNEKDLYRAFGEMDDDILARGEGPALRRTGTRHLKWGVLAACLALAVGLTGAAFAAEAREYGAAVEFFTENGLSTEGLNRSDVKAVYRDITTQRFTYGKTAEVLQRAVTGVEISQKEPTPEELAELWNQNLWQNAQPGNGVSYRIDLQYQLSETLGFDVLNKSVLECSQDGEPIWTVEFPGLLVEGSVHTSAGTAVWCRNDTWSSEQPDYAYVARVDEDGTILWQKRLDHGFERESIAQVLDNGDGTWAVVSRGDLEYLCLSQYDVDGNELSFRKTQVGNSGILNAIRLGDGYLVRLSGEPPRLVKLVREGDLTDAFTYEGEDCAYCITGMAEFGGRVYLSAYAVPMQAGEGGRYEIADILDYVFGKGTLDISSEELTPLVRDNYTAVLLLCDPEGGAPETFYSVKGSLGGALNVNDAGELEWDVESIAGTFFSPATSSFTIGGNCRVYRYTFDGQGTLIGQEDTGETTPYRR